MANDIHFMKNYLKSYLDKIQRHNKSISGNVDKAWYQQVQETVYTLQYTVIK